MPTVVGECRLEAKSVYGSDRAKSKLVDDAIQSAGEFLEKLPKSGFRGDAESRKELKTKVYRHLVAQNYQAQAYGFGPITTFFFWWILRQILMWVAEIIVRKLLNRYYPVDPKKPEKKEEYLDVRIV